MQNISKNLKQITMKKIEKYVVFKYEDEFGFHYMKMDKLPGEGPTYTEPISFEKKINPQLYPGSHHSTAVFRGRKIRLCAQLKICPRVWLVERQSRSSGMAGKDPGL